MDKLKYIKFAYNLGDQFEKEESYEYVKFLQHETNKSDRKILFVLDFVPSEDLGSGRLFSGVTGKLFENICSLSKNFYKEPNTLSNTNWLVVNYNATRTAGKSSEYQESAEEAFKKRLIEIIFSYKPDVVVTFGRRPFYALNREKIEWAKGKAASFLGTHIKTVVKRRGKKFKFNHVPTLSLNTLVTAGKKGGTDMYAAGYVARCLQSAFHGKLPYKIPKLDYEAVLIDSVQKFDKMLDVLKEAEHVAIDTETENLNRVTNKLLTVQFAKCSKYAYILPVYHKDSPFTPKELKYIANRLRNYFETDNANKLHIFANAQFDLNVLRSELKIRFFKTNVWDIFAGEFVFDENMKFVNAITGEYYYSLGNITMQYGCDAYVKAAFGKADRKNIAKTDLNKDLIEYCALDVIIPIHIQRLQVQRAAAIGYAKYESVVGEQISDTIHSFSTMEHNGVHTDVDYLFYLMTPESPVRAEMDKIHKELSTSSGIKKANKLLAERSGAPKVGLFSNQQISLFNMRKNAHKQLLFFDVLGLKPLKIGKNGVGKIDKEFQKKYKDVPEVKLFSEMSAAKKLYDAYVKSFIKLWGKSADFQSDRYVRPSFGYLGVVTGRTNAEKPNLQQIPSRSELGKHIKRLFVAPKGKIFIKVDYSAHEVRGWSFISGDMGVADLFKHGLNLRKKFKLKPSKKLAERISTEGDVHKLNASYFFGVNIKDVTKEIRNSVKGVIFGFIYQQGEKNLAKNTGQELNALRDLVARFKKRFPKGVKWFDKIKQFAREHFFVESPLGRRRHLWGYLLPANADGAEAVHARLDRQGVNSPIQGMGSDFMMTGVREFEKCKWEYYQEHGVYPDMKACTTVHDSLLVEVSYEWVWLAIKFIEESLVDRVQEQALKRHGMKFTVPLEIEFDIGATEKHLTTWHYDWDGFVAAVDKTLEVQQKELGYDIDIKKVRKTILNQKQYMPKWMRKQLSLREDKREAA